MKKRLLLFLCLLGLWTAFNAYSATVIGVVVNGANGSPVNGATVALRANKAQAITHFN